MNPVFSTNEKQGFVPHSDLSDLDQMKFKVLQICYPCGLRGNHDTITLQLYKILIKTTISFAKKKEPDLQYIFE